MSEASAFKGEKKATKIIPASGVSKVIELQAESSKSWEDAVQICLAEAVRTLKHISSISVERMSASIKDDAIHSFQVQCKVSFHIDDSIRTH